MRILIIPGHDGHNAIEVQIQRALYFKKVILGHENSAGTLFKKLYWATKNCIGPSNLAQQNGPREQAGKNVCSAQKRGYDKLGGGEKES